MKIKNGNLKNGNLKNGNLKMFYKLYSFFWNPIYNYFYYRIFKSIEI